MPSCKLVIVFDRPERTFLPGEEVTGHVEVRADADVPCKALTLTHLWRTHGKGNTARGPASEQTLFSGAWRAGDYQRYPFRFLAPERPFSYRGNYLNIDHYVLARADVPWALDPKTEEEFILLPGPTGSHPPELLKQITPKPKANSQAAVIVGAVLAVAGVLTFPCGIPLILIGLGIVFFSLKQRLAESRLGDVRFGLEPQLAAPGDALAVSIGFTPQKACTINQVYAQVTCQESCVSGSGTNKSTHVHKVYSQAAQLATAQEVPAGRPVQLQSTLTLPETSAYSFDASDNDLTWEVEFRIDIPRWPDWVEKRKLVVVPRGHAGPPAADRSPLASTPVMAAKPIEVAEIVEERSTWPEPIEPPPVEPVAAAGMDKSRQVPEAVAAATSTAVSQAAASSPAGALSLAEVLTRISQADRFNGERQQLVEGCRGLRFPGTIVVERVSRNYSYDDDPAFRDGRIVLGKPDGTDLTVSVKTPNSLNEALDALATDDRWPLYCTLHKWDDLFNRAELRVVS